MSTVDPITNFEDQIDSRDVIDRIAYLVKCTESNDPDDALTDEETTELATLQALATEGESATDDWPHGATLIRESYFATYAEELAEETSDTGHLSDQWPYTHIDWEGAARELQMDYTSITFDGIDYWVR